jgi:hypothetical protein
MRVRCISHPELQKPVFRQVRGQDHGLTIAAPRGGRGVVVIKREYNILYVEE